MKPSCRIACVTMVRDEPVFLPRWVAHWRSAVASAQLFILADGPDQDLSGATEDCQIIRLPRLAPAYGWEASRWRLLSSFATTLLERFDVVVLNDVDELIVADPADGRSLAEALAEARDLGVIKPFGIEVMHHITREPGPLDPGQPVLGQRRFCRINALYFKPCIIARPVTWSMGGHFCDFPQLNLSSSLWLLHLRAMDGGILQDRHALRRRHVTDDTGKVIWGVAGAPWADDRASVEQSLAAFAGLDPVPLDRDCDKVRQRIARTWTMRDGSGIWSHDHMVRLRQSRSYEIPDRFLGLV